MEEKPSVLRALFDKYREIIMYCVFGVTTTIISWLVYSVCEKAFSLVRLTDPEAVSFVSWIIEKTGEHTDVNTFLVMLLSGVISWIVAVLVAFVTNKLWVFDSKSWERRLVRKEALTFFGGRIATGLLEVLAVPAIVSWGFNAKLFGVDGLPAKILVSVAIVILNYILSKFISFRTPEEKAE
ncbi:MAG: GtrA family protein [Oscillospiraceae bacterium]|nr:GtrA family protein [Oscillospiraceae bacterium]